MIQMSWSSKVVANVVGTSEYTQDQHNFNKCFATQDEHDEILIAKADHRYYSVTTLKM